MKRNISGKKNRKIVFLGGCEHSFGYYKIGKHNLCSEGKTIQNRGFSRHRGRYKMALLVAKVPFSEGASKGTVTICDTQKQCSAENTFL